MEAALPLAAGVVAAAILVSGGSSADPETPPALPGRPAPFLGTAVAGGGGLTAAIDAYGAVVDLRPGGPAGAAAIAVSSERQRAGTVPPHTGIVPRVSVGGPALPLWRARWVRQRYVRGSNVVRTEAALGPAEISILDAAPPGGRVLVREATLTAAPRQRLGLSFGVRLDPGATRARCTGLPPPATRTAAGDDAEQLLSWRGRGTISVRLSCAFGAGPAPGADPVGAAIRADRRWLAGGSGLGPGAPGWARRMQARSLLVLRALTDAKSGAAVAGARDGWAYVWPRDAAAVAIALAAAGRRAEARRIAAFLLRLDPRAGVRFRGDRSPVDDGRHLQGDAEGWIAAAAVAAGLRGGRGGVTEWRDRADYGERSGDKGDYLANAIAAGAGAATIRAEFGSGRLLVRRAGDPRSGLDSAVAWAVRPFPRPALFAAVRASLRRLTREEGRFGIEPAESWPGEDAWSAPTAWVAWSLAALGERRAALAELAALRRASTPAGTLPERVDASTGIPVSTTPLGWSHAFTVLALLELWPPAA